MLDRETIINGLEIILHGCDDIQCWDCEFQIKTPATPARCGLDEEQIKEAALALLKEQEEQKRKWLQAIADNQLAVSPTGYETEEDLAKRTGEWNGLQMAWDILTEGR